MDGGGGIAIWNDAARQGDEIDPGEAPIITVESGVRGIDGRLTVGLDRRAAYIAGPGEDARVNRPRNVQCEE